MPKLNNEVVSVNDTVYDVSNGSGTVTAVTEKTIEVLFANGRRITFNQHGSINGIRRLFWHNPIFLDPPKDFSMWQKITYSVINIFRLIKNFND